MDQIKLQSKATPKEGLVEYYWFENKKIGLENTLFHRIEIPFEPFDSGLEWVSQPESPTLTIEWLDLKLFDPKSLDKLNLSSKNYPNSEASIYIGTAHNWVTINKMEISNIENDVFLIDADISIDFESEGVASNESYSFGTRITFQEKA